MQFYITLFITLLLTSCAWDSEQGLHVKLEEQAAQKEDPHFYECFGENEFGKFVKGGGCNAFGCWIEGGACNEFGCNITGPCTYKGCSKKTTSTKCVP